MSTNQKKERSLKCTVVLMESGWFLLVDVSATQDIKRRVAHVKVSGAARNRAALPKCVSFVFVMVRLINFRLSAPLVLPPLCPTGQ